MENFALSGNENHVFGLFPALKKAAKKITVGDNPIEGIYVESLDKLYFFMYNQNVLKNQNNMNSL